MNQAYINISGLEPGPLQLRVVNSGSSATAALGFGYIHTEDSLPRKAKKHGKVIGAAVGASLGAVLLIGILAIIVIRRRRRRLQGEAIVDGVAGEIKATRMSETRNDLGERTAYPGQTPVTVAQDGKGD